MKLLPHRRRQSEEVKRTSKVLDDYANLLSRDSGFLAATAGGGEEASVATTLTPSDHASTVGNGTSGSRPSVVTLASVAPFARQEVTLGVLLGKGSHSKVYAITSIELSATNNNSNATINNDSSMTNNSDVEDAIVCARSAMSQNARAGQYAMKRLRKKLLRRNRGEFTRAAAALVVEAQFLSKLDHSHILKLRGSALGGASSFQTGDHDAFFLILDRVSETLHDRIYNKWAGQRSTAAGSSSSSCESELIHQKTHYSLQLASAMTYLHDRRIIFRDVKPANLGFSCTDDQSIQLFDFGMARELPVALGLGRNELFHMTQATGTKPYTAVEVGNSGLYNLSADVYSFAMTVYEMMVEQMPFGHHMQGGNSNGAPPMTTVGGVSKSNSSKKGFSNNRAFVQAVYIDGERPVFDFDDDSEGSAVFAPAPPQDIQDLLVDCWQTDLFARPTMEAVVAQLQVIMKRLDVNATTKDKAAIPPTPQAPTVVVEAQEVQQRQKMHNMSTAQKEGSFTDMSDISNV